MEFNLTEAVPSVTSRHEKSLGLLTIKFVRLLQNAPDGVVDLKMAVNCLAVKQKRRIYDITNVLEGVGLLEKKSKNKILWRGEKRDDLNQKTQDDIGALKAQIALLDAQEKVLDEHKALLEESIRHINSDPISCAFKFVTLEEVSAAFGGETLLVIVAPAGTQIEVPLPEKGKSLKYQMNLRSPTAPIQILLINSGSASGAPVVFTVPPTDQIFPLLTPPSTPATFQRFPVPMPVGCGSDSSQSSFLCSQDSVCSDHKMTPPDYGDILTPSCTPSDFQTDASYSLFLEHQIDLQGSEVQSLLDVGGVVTLSTTIEVKEEQADDAIDMFDGVITTNEYNLQLDENEGVSDIFDMQIFN